MVDRRVGLLVREQYTQRPVYLAELFPENIGKSKFIDYLLERTLNRPRDAIAFVNECLKRAEGKGRVSVQTVREAEIDYSAGRFAALCYEWITHYPLLAEYFRLVEKMPFHFRLQALSKERVDDFCFANCIEAKFPSDPVVRAGVSYLNSSNNSHHSVVISVVNALYSVGVLGIKPDSFSGQFWSFKDARAPSEGQIKPSSEVFIHPMVWSRCGIIPKSDERKHRRS
jgi:hypothetical protein